MGHRAVERVLVRMHFDPAFVAAVHRDPEGVLGPLGLDADERADLLAIDLRAFGVDAQRRARTLKTLCEEFRASSTVLLARGRSRAQLTGFFSSGEFHACVQERGSMAAAFARFLHRLAEELGADAVVPALIELEAEQARARRELDEPPPPPPPGHVGRCPGVRGGRFDGATIEALNVVERLLFELAMLPAMALADDRPGLPPLPAPRPDAPVALLIAPGGTAGVSLSATAHAVAAALAELETPAPAAVFVSRAGARGLPVPAAARLLDELVQAGLLRRGA